jgi:uridine kinase
MKIAVLISGYLRTIEHNFNKLKNILEKHDYSIYLHISNNDESDHYNNKKNDLNNILKIINPKKIIIEHEQEFTECKYINQKKMWYKIHILNNLKKQDELINNFKYDIVMRIRPDLLILENNIDFEKYSFDDNLIYGNITNNIFSDELNFGSSNSMNIYSDLFLNFDKYNSNDINRPEIFLKLHCENKNLQILNSNIKHKLLLTLCNIIAISGDSGSGKTTLMKCLEFIFNNDLLKIEGDRYHKWERGNENWNKYTHLNPEANYISKYCDDVYNLKIGNNIYQVDYDHSNGKFTEIEKLENKQNIILCGLHTLFDKNTNNLLNFKIFVNTDENLRKYWKIKRDVKERGYDVETVLQQMDKRINDYNTYVKPQINNCDLEINFYTDENINYKNINIKPNIYLKLCINKKYNILNFIEKLINNNIAHNFEKKNNGNINLYFNIIDIKFNIILSDIMLNYCKTYKLENNNLSYYTIIISLIIFLLN